MAKDTAESEFHNRLLWGAVRVLSVGIVSKFASSFRRNKRGVDSSSPTKIKPLLRSARLKIQGAENIISVRDTNDISPYQATLLLLLQQQIYDYLHEIHQELLEKEVDRIVEIIPLLDKLLHFWNPDHSPAYAEAELVYYQIVFQNMAQKLRQQSLI